MGSRKRATVTLEIDLDREGLEFRVRDESPGFDPTRLPDPFAPENLYRTSGRGNLPMKALMDTVAFRRRPSAAGASTSTPSGSSPVRAASSGSELRSPHAGRSSRTSP